MTFQDNPVLGKYNASVADLRRVPKGQRAPVPLPSLERLRAAFTCDPDRGTLVWKFDPTKPNSWNARYADTPAGYQAKSGYIVTALDGVKYRSHRIIWKMCSGNDSIFLIDHINGDQTDNRFSNLREATISQNLVNREGDPSRGVYLHRQTGTYHARLHLEEGCLSLGYFKTADEASEVYKRAAMKYHGEFIRHVGVELHATYERIAKLEAALAECIDYFEGRADADCDQDGFIPNEEMKMLNSIDETLHGPGGF